MDKTKLTLAALLAAVAAHDVYLQSTGEEVALAVEVAPEAVEIKGEAKAPIEEKIARTTSTNSFKCSPDEQRGGELFCFDGVDKSFYLDAKATNDLVDEAKGDDVTIVVVDGKVFAAAPAVDAKADAAALAIEPRK